MKYIISLLLAVQFVLAQNKMKPEETEVWEPEPRLVHPGIYNAPPSDAIVLFDGSDFSKWRNERTQSPVGWTLNPDRSMTIKPGSGSIETLEEHGSIQLHIEWKSPTNTQGKGQLRGNSGIFFQRRYEVQVLNSYQNRTYSNGQAGSIYKQHIPLVNAMRPTGEWQIYDIVFNAPEFNEAGEEISLEVLLFFTMEYLSKTLWKYKVLQNILENPKKGVMKGFVVWGATQGAH